MDIKDRQCLKVFMWGQGKKDYIVREKGSTLRENIYSEKHIKILTTGYEKSGNGYYVKFGKKKKPREFSLFARFGSEVKQVLFLLNFFVY